MSSHNEKEKLLKEAFDKRQEFLKALGAYVIEFIETQLRKDLGIDNLVPAFLKMTPESRVKDTDSFLEKALFRKPKEHPLEEITDQVGVRFVVLLQKDICRINKIIVNNKEWIVQQDRDFEKERLEKPDFFSYQSDHFVILNKVALNYNDISIPANIPCEIQVRTLLQHAYAEMAHDSDYKPSLRLPTEDAKHVRRSLAKGSALIETTDSLFEEIKNRFDEYDAKITEILTECAGIYEKLIEEKSNPFTFLGSSITDSYRNEINNITLTEIKDFYDYDKNPLLSSIIYIVKDKRQYNIFYRDSVILLVYFLIYKFPIVTAKKWPIDVSYLRNLYVDSGSSPDAYGL